MAKEILMTNLNGDVITDFEKHDGPVVLSKEDIVAISEKLAMSTSGTEPTIDSAETIKLLEDAQNSLKQKNQAGNFQATVKIAKAIQELKK